MYIVGNSKGIFKAGSDGTPAKAEGKISCLFKNIKFSFVSVWKIILSKLKLLYKKIIT